MRIRPANQEYHRDLNHRRKVQHPALQVLPEPLQRFLQLQVLFDPLPQKMQLQAHPLGPECICRQLLLPRGVPKAR
jgi:hypothetical protein